MIAINRFIVAGIIFAFCLKAPTIVFATVPDTPTVTSEELQKGLDADSTQDYDRDLLGNGTTKPDESLPNRLQRELGAAAQAEKTDKPAMAKVVEAMRDVQPRLAHRDAGETTQHIEDQIVSDLDRLVEEARKSCCSGQCNKGSSGKKPSESKNGSPKTSGSTKVASPHENPSQTSTEKRTNSLPSNTESDAGDIRSLVKRLWGELPESDRRQMLALPDEEFLPQYEEQTKEYLRRLSNGKKNSESQP